MKFSILTPAYNASQYIERCIKSILSQSYEDFEFIIVDDGSIDETFNLCKVYADTDTRIRLIRQNNQGVATTRNILFNESIGDWIVFVDADDYLSVDYLLTFKYYIDKHPKTEVFICDYYIEKGDRITDGISNNFSNTKEYLKRLLSYKCINTVLWGKAIQRKFIESYSISFKENINMGEDLLFMAYLFPNSKEITYINKKMYYWVVREGSMTSTTNLTYKTNTVAVYNLIDVYYQNNEDFHYLIPYVKRSMLMIKSEFRSSREPSVKELSYLIFDRLSYHGLGLTEMLLLSCLRLNLTICLKLIRKFLL